MFMFYVSYNVLEGVKYKETILYLYIPSLWPVHMMIAFYHFPVPFHVGRIVLLAKYIKKL